MHDAAAYYWQTPQTSEVKQNDTNQQTTTGSFGNPESKIIFRSFRILLHFYMYFKAKQFQTMNDSSVPNTSLIWLLGLTHMQDSVIGINSVYDEGNIDKAPDYQELGMLSLGVVERDT